MAGKPRKGAKAAENGSGNASLDARVEKKPSGPSRREELIGSIRQTVSQVGNAFKKRKKKVPKSVKKKAARNGAVPVNTKPGNQFTPLEQAAQADHDDDGDVPEETLIPGAVGDGEDEEGFIAFDDEEGLSDVAESINTAFRAFEDEITKAEEEAELDFVSVPGDEGSKKRKRGVYDEDVEGPRRKVSATAEYPWVKIYDKSKYAYVVDWLTTEVKDFVAYMSPSEAEIKARNAAVQNIRKIVSDLWPDAEAHVFGSFATDLYLPGSDIDMVVLSKDGRYSSKSHLFQLAARLRSSKVGTQFEVLAKTRVPIIKFVEAKSRIRVDISFERENGVRAVETIRRWARDLPALRYLVIVVKQFLARRHLNEVHTGGLGGYAVICLIVSFMKNHPRVATNTIDPMSNLGVLLIEFFELYGKNFNYDNLALCMTGSMPYLRKRDHPDLSGRNPFSIAIQDPADESNNISRGSFNLRAIKKAFAGAFDGLTARCYEMEREPFKNRVGKSILGNVIRVRGPERDFEDYTAVVVNEARLPLPMELPSASDDGKKSDGPGADVYFELSDSDDNAGEVETKEQSNVGPVEIDSSDDDDDDDDEHRDESNAAEPANDHTNGTADSDSESRTVATAIDKERKRSYWASKSGAI